MGRSLGDEGPRSLPGVGLGDMRSLGAAAGVQLTAAVAGGQTPRSDGPWFNPTPPSAPQRVIFALPRVEGTIGGSAWRPGGTRPSQSPPGTFHSAGSDTEVGLPSEVCVSPETWRMTEDPLLVRRGSDTGVDSKEPRAPACPAGPEPQACGSAPGHLLPRGSGTRASQDGLCCHRERTLQFPGQQFLVFGKTAVDRFCPQSGLLRLSEGPGRSTLSGDPRSASAQAQQALLCQKAPSTLRCFPPALTRGHPESTVTARAREGGESGSNEGQAWGSGRTGGPLASCPGSGLFAPERAAGWAWT